MERRASRRVSRWLAIVAAAGLVAGGCSSPEVAIVSAQRSVDDLRLELAFDSCNARLQVTVAETADVVTVVAVDLDAPAPELASPDCADGGIVELDAPLGDRQLIDGATGDAIPFWGPADPNQVIWPYDRERFTKADYLEALEAVVACIEAKDPRIDAYLVEGLNWMRYSLDAPNDVNLGSTIEDCHTEHLDPLR